MPQVTLSSGDTLHYEEKGKGTALVFLHGFPLDRRIWQMQVDALSDSFRVITPDLRGFGQSRSTRAFSLADLADDIHELLGKLNALPCILGGLSMGGYVTFAYVVKYPGDLKGMILIDTKHEADNADQKAGRMKMIEALRAGGSAAVADAMEPKMLAPGAVQGRPEVARMLRQIMEGCPPQTIEHALLAMRDRADHGDKLGSIACPTLIIVGESDQITPAAGAEAMRRQIRNSKLVVIKGAGHMTPMEEGEEVTVGIREFATGLG